MWRLLLTPWDAVLKWFERLIRAWLEKDGQTSIGGQNQ
jgi:hypothetical protein